MNTPVEDKTNSIRRTINTRSAAVFFLIFAAAAGGAIGYLRSQEGSNPPVISTAAESDECPYSIGSIIFGTGTRSTTLKSGDGTQTKFYVPKAYYDPRYDFSDENFIAINALVQNMKPICYSANYALHDSNAYLEKVIRLKIDPTIPEGFDRSMNRRSETDYPEFMGKEGAFKVYRSKKAADNGLTKGFKDFLVPEEGYFSRPSYVECVRPGLRADTGERSACIVSQQYNPHIWIEYSFGADHLSDVQKIDAQIGQFLQTLIAR